MNELNELIIKKETGINRELFKKYFNFQIPSAMLKNLYNSNDINKNNELVNIMKSGSSGFKNEIENMSEKEKEIKKPYEIVNIVEKILEFNK